MIQLHFSTIIAIVVIGFILYKLFTSTGKSGYDYSFNLMPFVWGFALVVAVILIGGIWWW